MSEQEEQENVEILRALYAKWGDKTLHPGDWMNVLAEDVQWCSIGDGVPGLGFAKAARSKSEVSRYFEQLAKEWEMLHYSVDELVAQGERVVVLGSCAWRSRRTGKTVETPKADVFRMRDGKVTEFYEFFDTAGAQEAARGSASERT